MSVLGIVCSICVIALAFAYVMSESRALEQRKKRG